MLGYSLSLPLTRVGLKFIDSNPQGGDLVSTMPVCVCPKVKDMGPFLASIE